MGSAIVLAAIAATGLIAVVYPWIGVIASYFIGIFNPQAVWWYHFNDLRPVYWIQLPTIAGLVIAGLKQDLHYRPLASRQVLYLSIFWLACLVSLLAAPYAVSGDGLGVRSAAYVFETQTKILLLLVFGCFCINDERRLKYVTMMLLGSAVYMVYWANSQYLSGYFRHRLPGPMDLYGSGHYADANNFAAFFVATLPFLWYLGYSTERLWLRWASWLVIPFAWHAVFLTGSRGGLIGLVLVTLWIALRSKRRLLGLLLIPAFAIAFSWQAGDVMKERAGTIDEYREEGSAVGRLEAWETAMNMMTSHPLTGVGPGAFIRAFPNYSDFHPRQAHNTYMQIGAEYGPVAGLMLLAAVLSSIVRLRRNGENLTQADPKQKNSFLYLLNESILAGLIGLLTCSMLLTLQLFELLYFLLFLSIVVIELGERRMHETGVISLGIPQARVSGSRHDGGSVAGARS